MANPLLEVRHISKGFDGTGVLEDVSLTIHEGEVLVVVGPSGCAASPLPAISAIWWPCGRRWAWCSRATICSRTWT